MAKRRTPFRFTLIQRLTPARSLVSSFALLVCLGTALLYLPGMTTKPLSFLDTLFTATSAVCVTGLIVVDTGTAFSGWGQGVILVLIQLGGLGIMTFSVFLYKMIGASVSLRDELAVREALAYSHEQDAVSLVRSVVLLTLAVEAVGAAILFFLWLGDYSAGRAAVLAVFHSVSAFCNAGFSLFPDSLTRYANSGAVNFTVIGLIIIGGLGFIAIRDICWPKPNKTKRRLSLHTKVVLAASLSLLLLGWLVFIAMEWNNVLAGRSMVDKMTVALFQSVTTRTAGFNTVDFAHLSNPSLLTSMLLMFIGGSPGSTAGGVKTVTFALLVAMGISRLKGFSRVNIFHRSVPNEVVTRSLTIILVAILVVGMAFGALLVFETGGMDHMQTRDFFVELLFETISAYGTVGLSMGVTGGLTSVGKVVIILTMFLGRVGSITVAMALLEKFRKSKSYNYGPEDLMVG